jgi:hypothetical protein
VAERGGSRAHERWARLRFSIIGTLLAAPPAKGALHAALQQLAAREWRHPSTGAPVRFGVSTLERWFYRARNERHDPVGVLRRKRRRDAGAQASMTPALREALLAQYGAHKSWSAQRCTAALVHEYPDTDRHSGRQSAHRANEGRIGDPDARTVAWQTVLCPDAGTHAVQVQRIASPQNPHREISCHQLA